MNSRLAPVGRFLRFFIDKRGRRQSRRIAIKKICLCLVAIQVIKYLQILFTVSAISLRHVKCRTGIPHIDWLDRVKEKGNKGGRTDWEQFTCGRDWVGKVGTESCRMGLYCVVCSSLSPSYECRWIGGGGGGVTGLRLV